MPAQTTKPEWTQAHQDALDAMRTMKVPEKEARKLLETLPPGEAGDLMRQALRARSGTIARKPPVPPGGPQNAMPLNPVPSAAGAPPPLPQELPKNMPPLPAAAGPAPAQKRGPIENVIRFMVGGGAPQRPPNAPIGPAAAQLSIPSISAPSPTQPAMPGPGGEKPRIRVRAAGGPVPAAPIGGGAPAIGPGATPNAPGGPAAAPQKPATQQAAPPRIRSEEEYEKLPPGERFVWIPDGHIYRKPAEGGEE